MDLGLKGKRALVTGGTAGIGFAIAKLLAQEGAEVTVASRDEAKVKAASTELRAKGVVMDLTSEASIEGALSKIGAVDILVNNVGGPAAGLTMDISLADWDKGYATLVRSPILLSKKIVPGMRKAKWGRILTVTSTTSRELIQNLPVSATFRAGLTAWAKAMARELGRDGILVNNLCPGPTNTARLKDLEKKSPDFYRSMATESGVGRIAEPEEIGRVAVFLCSNANTFVTGTDVLADGGYTKAL